MDINSVEFNMEILRMARDIVVTEYFDKKAQDHNKWLAESDRQWKSNKAFVPYPTFPPFPNEIAILEKARALHDFLSIDGSSIKCDKNNNLTKIDNPSTIKLLEEGPGSDSAVDRGIKKVKTASKRN